jgi:tRNA uridine 5-carboxymethylaminomethyl modification enzyme
LKEIVARFPLAAKDRVDMAGLTAADFLKRPSVKLEYLLPSLPSLAEVASQAYLTLETEIKFAGYLARQEREVKRLASQESLDLPRDLDFWRVPGLSREAAEILGRSRPLTLGQASRLRGVTPASLSALAIFLHKQAA